MAQIAASQCTNLSTAPGFYLRDDAARAWDRAVTAYGKRVLLTGAWRSLETQERLFDRVKYPSTGRYLPGRTSPYGDYRRYKGQVWGRVVGAAAAVPGTSNHGSGLAVDVKTSRSAGDPAYPKAVVFTSFNDPDRLAFLKVAAAHGWADDEGRSVGELWHLTYYPARDKHRGEKPAASKPAKPAALRPRKFHTRVTTRATHVHKVPGRQPEGRLLPEGYRFTVWDGAAKKVGSVWWVQTTSGNWVRSGSTRKLRPAR
jgi:hypothetical protein